MQNTLTLEGWQEIFFFLLQFFFAGCLRPSLWLLCKQNYFTAAEGKIYRSLQADSKVSIAVALKNSTGYRSHKQITGKIYLIGRNFQITPGLFMKQLAKLLNSWNRGWLPRRRKKRKKKCWLRTCFCSVASQKWAFFYMI